MAEDDEPTVFDLVRSAAAGNRDAWDSLVVRYLPLVTSVASRYRMTEEDVADVSQTVWLQLVQHLGRLRTPEALPGWIQTTTQRECFRVLRMRQRSNPYDPLVEPPTSSGAGQPEQADLDADLLRRERHAALLAAFAELPDHQRDLLALLVADPPWSYEEISARLGIAKGGIGPTRQRALERLRRSPAIAALMTEDLLETMSSQTVR